MSDLSADRLDDRERRTRRAGFGAEAERYDRVRPTYPAALFDAIAAYGGLDERTRVLEIGPGTGQATRSLLERGWSVEAVELDPAMAAGLGRRVRDRAAVHVGAFETHPAPDPPVDLVLAATAFHWLDPAVRLDRVADALRPGGVVALVWSRHVRGGTQAFFDAADACYTRWGGGEPAMRLLDEAEVEPRTGELAGSSRFTDVEPHRFVAELMYGTTDFLDLVRTHSDTIALDEPDRAALLRCLGGLLDGDFGGRVVKRTAFDLVLARRR